MRGIGIQAGFGEFLGTETLQGIKSKGMEIVRIDLQSVKGDLNKSWNLCEEVINNGLQPLAIVRTAEQIEHLPWGTLVEVGNEPDLAHFGWTVETYNRTVRECIPVAEARGLKMYVGVVSNLNRRGFAFLKTMDWKSIPSDVGCSIHRYPNGHYPTDPHAGSKSREDEVAQLKALVGPRPLACTEVGYHTSNHQAKSGPFGIYTKTMRWTDQEVAAHMKWEREFFTGQGFDIVIAFQINDGAGVDTESRFGFRTPSNTGYQQNDWQWKPVAETWAK